jgi:T5SS/PEP-CTERM-associated repeat protein
MFATKQTVSGLGLALAVAVFAAGEAIGQFQIPEVNGKGTITLSGNDGVFGPPRLTVCSASVDLENPGNSVACELPNDPLFSASGQISLTASRTTASTSASASVQATGSSAVQLNDPNQGFPAAFLEANITATFSIDFDIEPGQAFSLAVQHDLQPAGETRVSVTLERDGEELGRIAINTLGAANDPPTSTLPTGGATPGSYLLKGSLTCEAIQAGEGAGQGFDLSGTGILNLNASVTISGASETVFFWKEPAGGDYFDPNHWDPSAGAPPRREGGRDDTAVFAVSGPLPIHAFTTATAGFWRIQGTALSLTGSAQLFGAADDTIDLEILNGGTLNLPGASLETDVALVGSEGSAETRLAVTGVGELKANELDIGRGAPGVVEIRDGGRIDMTGDRLIFMGDPRSGTLRVENSGTVSAGEISVGEGPGRVEVRGKGSLTADQLFLGTDSGGTGSLVIEDGGVITLGRASIGSINVEGGEKVTVSGIHSDGERSTLRISNGLSVAGDVGTELEVRDGALLDTTGVVGIGGDLSVGRLLVNDGGVWNSNGNVLADARLDPTEILVTSGGSVTVVGSILLADGPDTVGRLRVAASGSRVTATELVVGDDGHGELLIESGGRVDTLRAVVGLGTEGADPPAIEPGFGDVRIEGGLTSSSGVACCRGSERRH